MSDPQEKAPSPPGIQFITVVSGLPRSGTSMMMRMLESGGMQILTDHVRAADDDNPKGYFELERVKRLRDENDWLATAEGKVLKVISFLLGDLPANKAYRVIFMRRTLPEVLASQRKMLEHRGTPVADPEADDRRMRLLYEKHLWQVQRWLATQPNMRTLYVEHRRAVESPMETARTVAAFLGGDLDVTAMASAVDPQLHRQKCQ